MEHHCERPVNDLEQRARGSGHERQIVHHETRLWNAYRRVSPRDPTQLDEHTLGSGRVSGKRRVNFRSFAANHRASCEVLRTVPYVRTLHTHLRRPPRSTPNHRDRLGGQNLTSPHRLPGEYAHSVPEPIPPLRHRSELHGLCSYLLPLNWESNQLGINPTPKAWLVNSLIRCV